MSKAMFDVPKPKLQTHGLACEGKPLHLKGIFEVKRQILIAVLVLSAVAFLPKMSFAHNIAAGCDDKKTPVNISDENNWKTLCEVTLDLSDGVHDCVATASATVGNTVSDFHNEYRFTLARSKNPSTNDAAEQMIDLIQDTGADPEDVPVSATRHFQVSAGSARNFFWLARPADSSADSVDVNRFAMAVVCTDGK